MVMRRSSHKVIRDILKEDLRAIYDFDLLYDMLSEKFEDQPDRREWVFLIAKFGSPLKMYRANYISNDLDAVKEQDLRSISRISGIGLDSLKPYHDAWAKAINKYFNVTTVDHKSIKDPDGLGRLDESSLENWLGQEKPDHWWAPANEFVEAYLMDFFPNEAGHRERLLFLSRIGSLDRLKKENKNDYKSVNAEVNEISKLYNFPSAWLKNGILDALDLLGISKESKNLTKQAHKKARVKAKAEGSKTKDYAYSARFWNLIHSVFLVCWAVVIFELPLQPIGSDLKEFLKEFLGPISFAYSLFFLRFVFVVFKTLHKAGGGKSPITAVFQHCFYPVNFIYIPLLWNSWYEDFNRFNKTKGWGLKSLKSPLNYYLFLNYLALVTLFFVWIYYVTNPGFEDQKNDTLVLLEYVWLSFLSLGWVFLSKVSNRTSALKALQNN